MNIKSPLFIAPIFLCIADYSKGGSRSFSWETYLKDTKSVAAPARAFKQRPPSGFRRGMKLECVDKRVPMLIRVATVDDVSEHQIRIKFDGWPDQYSYWIDDDSPDIRPVGWCQKTGHSLEPPLSKANVRQTVCCNSFCASVHFIILIITFIRVINNSEILWQISYSVFRNKFI